MGWLRQPGCASGEQFGDLGVVEPSERSAMVTPFQHGDLECVCCERAFRPGERSDGLAKPIREGGRLLERTEPLRNRLGLATQHHGYVLVDDGAVVQNVEELVRVSICSVDDC